MQKLSRKSILSRKCTVKAVESEELGGTVHVRQLSLADVESRLDPLIQDKDQKMAEVIILLVCDEDGSPLFQDGDAEAIRQLPGLGLVKLASEALKLNTITEKDLAASEKNSEATRS